MKKTNGAADAHIYSWEIGTAGNPISGGLNIADLEFMMADNQSPLMKNMWYDGRVLSKRPGQREICGVTEDILTMFSFGGNLIVAAGTKLYEISEKAGSFTPKEIFSGLSAKKGTFFKTGGKLYYLNGQDYIVFDGTKVEAVKPYVPTLIINRPPNGEGGSLVDNYNRLGGGFLNSFNGNGTDKVYTLTDRGLDAVTPIVVVDGIPLKNGFVFDNTAGTVSFSVAPAKGTNNVEITAFKAEDEMRKNLLSCTIAVNFGGTNDSRVFFAGNGTSTFYYSDVNSPDYFPENNYNVIGANSGEITGMAGQYGVLIFFLSGEIWQATYSFDGARVSFPLKAVNRAVGCDVPGSISLINNSLVFLSSKVGVCTIVSTSIADERNVQVISRNINSGKTSRGLLDEAGLRDAAAVDCMGKYWICVGGRAYLWDYENSPYVVRGNPDLDAKALSWFLFDGIAAKGFAELSGVLYFFYGNKIGVFDRLSFRDFGNAYEAIWRIPIRNFNVTNGLKSIVDIFVTVRTDTNASAKLKYITEESRSGVAEACDIDASSFSFASFAWDLFTLRVSNYFRTFRRKPRKRKTLYFAIEFYNNDAGRDMNLSGIVLTYRVAKNVMR